MIARCTNPKNIMYEYYGGRGIEICERWWDLSQGVFEGDGVGDADESSIQ